MKSAAFTVLELMTVIVIVSILAVLAFPVVGKLRARSERARCAANLISLHVATQLDMQDHENKWPQIRLNGDSDSAWEDFAKAWIGELKAYGPTATTWICPTRQHLLGNPDYNAVGEERVDYIATPFDDKPTTPGTIGRTVPWFSEWADVHGNGNLVIFADGSVTDVKTLAGK